MRAIEDFTGFPEMMDGRVKTLHPRLYAGLLAVRDDDAHLQAATEHEIEPVDLVCVNLYPFEQTVARGDAGDAEIVENIDIGGPTMIRAAAKNSAFAAGRGRSRRLRARARRAARVRRADLARHPHPAGHQGIRAHRALRRRDLDLVRAAHLRGISPDLARRLREGDRPALRREPPPARRLLRRRVGAPTHLLDGVSQLHGKELSFNNLLDLSSARELVEEFDTPACAIVKHNNPCGCALGGQSSQAYERAFACDPLSAYGGVIALNRPSIAPARSVCPSSSSRSCSRPASTPRRSRYCRRRKTCACWSYPTGPRPLRRSRASR